MTDGFTDFTAGGLTQPVDWSRQHEPWTDADPAAHGPARDCIALVQVVDEVFEVVGDAARPFTCWPGTTNAWSEPAPPTSTSAPSTGLEPVSYRLGGGRSIHLSYEGMPPARRS